MLHGIDFASIPFDQLVAFSLGILSAVTINAEAQAFVAQFLGDVRPEDTHRFHFNGLRHLDLLGAIAFFAAGFGWPRAVDIDSTRFKHPRLYTFMARVAGPVANFLLASIVSSLSLIIEQFSIDPQMFQIVLGVNLMVAVANLLPIPPLAAGTIPGLLIPERFSFSCKMLYRLGPYLLITLLLTERISQDGIVDRLCLPLFTPVFNFLTKSYSFG
jgi:Zn-dependent protease